MDLAKLLQAINKATPTEAGEKLVFNCLRPLLEDLIDRTGTPREKGALRIKQHSMKTRTKRLPH